MLGCVLHIHLFIISQTLSNVAFWTRGVPQKVHDAQSLRCCPMHGGMRHGSCATCHDDLLPIRYCELHVRRPAEKTVWIASSAASSASSASPQRQARCCGGGGSSICRQRRQHGTSRQFQVACRRWRTGSWPERRRICRCSQKNQVGQWTGGPQ